MDSQDNLRPLVTGQQILMVNFSEARRGGFEKAEVNAVLQQAANQIDALFRQVEELHAALDSTKAELAGVRAQPENTPTVAAVPESQRMLEAAAKAADMVEREARAEAETIRAAAARDAERTRSEADVYAAQTRDGAKSMLVEARAAAEGARARAEADIADLKAAIVTLEGQRDELEEKANERLATYHAQATVVRNRLADALNAAREQLLAAPLDHTPAPDRRVPPTKSAGLLGGLNQRTAPPTAPPAAPPAPMAAPAAPPAIQPQAVAAPMAPLAAETPLPEGAQRDATPGPEEAAGADDSASFFGPPSSQASWTVEDDTVDFPVGAGTRNGSGDPSGTGAGTETNTWHTSGGKSGAAKETGTTSDDDLWAPRDGTDWLRD